MWASHSNKDVYVGVLVWKTVWTCKEIPIILINIIWIFSHEDRNNISLRNFGVYLQFHISSYSFQFFVFIFAGSILNNISLKSVRHWWHLVLSKRLLGCALLDGISYYTSRPRDGDSFVGFCNV